MYNSAIALTLSSLVATALTPAAMAQGDPPRSPRRRRTPSALMLTSISTRW